MRPLVMSSAATAAPTLTPLLLAYGAVAGGLGFGAAAGGGGLLALAGAPERAVLGSMSLAYLLDLGPSAARDLTASESASRVAVADLMAASPPMVLVDNYVHNLGPEDAAQTERKQLAADRLAASHRWA